MSFEKLNMLLRLGREYSHETIRHAGFSYTEHAICTFLCFHDKVSQDNIANALLLDKTTVAKALRVLERDGLVHKKQDENNRRKNIIQLTEAGRTGVMNNIDIHENWLMKVCSCLSEQELQQLNGYFNRIIENAIKIRQDTMIK